MKAAGVLFFCALLVAEAQTFEVFERSIAEEQKAMTEGRVTSKDAANSRCDSLYEKLELPVQPFESVGFYAPVRREQEKMIPDTGTRSEEY